MTTLDDLEFAAIAAHELRTPLRHLRRLLDAATTLLRENSAEAAFSALGGAEEAAARMDRLIDQLAAHASAQGAPLNGGTVDLARLVDDVVARAQAQWGGKDRMPWVEIHVSHRARGDSALLEVAIENLLGNALRICAGRDGARVSVRSTVEDAVVVALAVEDNGPGFDPADATRLFRPFERLQRTHSDGSGLGLSIVARIAERHGGSVSAEALPAGGARFTLRLPLA